MRRFFVEPGTLSGPALEIGGDLFRHIISVLRLRSGDAIALADGCGSEATGRIGTVRSHSLTVHLEHFAYSPLRKESSPRIVLLQCLPKGDKFEMILQKATEIGVHEVVPVLSSRCVSRPAPEKWQERGKRWERIVTEAARQCGSAYVPVVHPLQEFGKALRIACDLKLLLWEEESGKRLREALEGETPPETVAFLVGPEGGVSTGEAQAATENSFIPVSLGTRILRTETAALVAVSLLKYRWGDLG